MRIAQSQGQQDPVNSGVLSMEIRVKPTPVIQAGPFSLGRVGAALFLLLSFAGGFGGGVWFIKMRRGQVVRRVKFAESEITKMFKLIMDDIEGFSQSHKTPTIADDDYTIERLKNTILKMEVYLKKLVNDIKR